MSLRALHIVNEPSGPGGLFLPPLESRGFAIDTVDTTQSRLPDSVSGYDAIISCGGTANTHETHIYPWIDPQIELLREALREDVPVIGLCLGAQLLTKAAGGNVYRCEPSEVGWVEVHTNGAASADPVLGGAPDTFTAMQWHRYACELPPGAVELGRNSTCLQAFRLGEAAWGTQFHIEVTREILLEWARWGGEDLEQAGYTQARYMEELERNLPPHEEIGRGMAERFAEVAATRARSAA